jgi:hypothetical protein
MSDEEPAWHAEADRVFAEFLSRAEVRRGTLGLRVEDQLEHEAADWLVSLALRCDDREYVPTGSTATPSTPIVCCTSPPIRACTRRR